MTEEELTALRARWAQLDPPDRDRVQTVVDLAKADVDALLAEVERLRRKLKNMRDTIGILEDYAAEGEADQR